MKRRIRQISSLPAQYGKYELLERIGTGGMAEVYRARLSGVGGLEKTVVIKRLRPKHAGDETMAQLFVEEAKLATQVHHRNIVQVYDVGSLEDSGELYMAMEYVRGTDLRRLIEHAVRAERAIPPWLAVFTACEVLEALSFAHELKDPGGRPRNLVHCDVTPENVFLSRLGDVKLGDFGVANDDTRINGPLADKVKGKLPYMSPEQVLEQPVDARTDVFSCAVVLWEALAGRRLFPGRTPSEVMAQICASPRPPPSRFSSRVTPNLDRVVLDALEPEIEARYQSAEALGHALRDVLSEIRPRLSIDDVRRELGAIMDAPVVHPDAAVFEQGDEDDGHDELEALDRMHEEPNVLRTYASVRSRWPGQELPQDISTPRPSIGPGREPDYRGITPTRSRFPAADAFAPDGPTYRIIRDRAPALPPEVDVDAIMQAYLADEDIVVASGISGSWDSAGLTPPPVLGGAAPIWLDIAGDERIGPLTPALALECLERYERRGTRPVMISTDQQRWKCPDDVARLLGEELLRRTAPTSSGIEHGQLCERSFIEIVGNLARLRSTGRLTVTNTKGEDQDQLELHLLGGTLTHISWTAAPFETWRALFDDPLLGAQGLPEAFSLSLVTNTPILPRLPASAEESVTSTRHRYARRRFEAAVAWTSGAYTFDPAGTVHASDRGQPILRLLPGMTYCALSMDELERRMLARLNRPHRLDPAFDRFRDELGLTEREAHSLEVLGGPHPLGVAARQAEHGTDGKFVWVMAYVLTELGLLSAA